MILTRAGKHYSLCTRSPIRCIKRATRLQLHDTLYPVTSQSSSGSQTLDAADIVRQTAALDADSSSFQGQVPSKYRILVRLPICITAGSNNQGLPPPNSSLLIPAGSQLFFKPLNVHFETSNLLLKWSCNLLFRLRLLLLPDAKRSSAHVSNCFCKLISDEGDPCILLPTPQEFLSP